MKKLRWTSFLHGKVLETQVCRSDFPGLVDTWRGVVLVDPDGDGSMAYVKPPGGQTRWAGRTFPSVRAAKRWVRQTLQGAAPR
jgi:hypothetical protein